jgi:phosphopantetheinyl transferase (holo-ACP synthase)
LISAGNDIVALKHVDASRTRQQKFYSKILSDSEFALYSVDTFPFLHFENFVWLLWSIKESVYKHQKRYDPALVFSPKKIIIKNIGSPENRAVTKFGEGEVEGNSADGTFFYTSIACSGAETLYGRSKIHSELIYSFVNSEENFEHIWWGVKFIGGSDYETQSKAVRAFAINKLSAIFPAHHLEIGKCTPGYPPLFKESAEMGIPVSLSHHGNFIAYCFLLTDL